MPDTNKALAKGPSIHGPRTMASDARRLKALEDENSKLEKLLFLAMRDSPEEDKSIQWIDLPRGDPEGCRGKKMGAPGVRREAVAHAVATHGVSRVGALRQRRARPWQWIGRACAVAACAPTTPRRRRR